MKLTISNIYKERNENHRQDSLSMATPFGFLPGLRVDQSKCPYHVINCGHTLF